MEKLGKLIVGSGEGSADMRYVSGLSTPDAFIWCSDGVGSLAVLSPLEFDRASREVKSGVRLIHENELGGGGRVANIVKLAEMSKLSGFVVPAEFPLALADALRNAGLTVRASDEGRFFPEREFKSAGEVELITASLRAAERGVERAAVVLADCSVADDGVIMYEGEALTSERLRAEIDAELLRRGTLPTGTICAGGVQGACPHCVGSGVLHAGTPIVMDVFPRSFATGYWGDLTRTVVKGRASDVVRRAYRAVLEVISRTPTASKATLPSIS